MEKLWLVLRFRRGYAWRTPFKVFRTRYAARKYAGDMRSRSRKFDYTVRSISWGPEQ
jgi:hypothetical protein